MRALLASLVLVALAAGPARAGVKKGDRAAELVGVVDGAGKKISLRKFQDQVVVMTFGASWCEPCKKELPAFEKLATRYYKSHAKVVFLAVNIDNEGDKGAKFMARAGLKCVRALFDKQKTAVESYDPPKMPSTFVIRRGIVKHVHAGFAAGDEAKLAAVIDRELAAH